MKIQWHTCPSQLAMQLTSLQCRNGVTTTQMTPSVEHTHKGLRGFFFPNTSLVMITWQHSPPQSSLIESSSSTRKGPTRRYEHSTISFSFFFSFLPRTTLPQTFLPVPDWSLRSNGMHSTKNKLPISTALSESQSTFPISTIRPMTTRVKSWRTNPL